MKKIFLVLFVFLGLMFVGCGEKPDPTPTPGPVDKEEIDEIFSNKDVVIEDMKETKIEFKFDEIDKEQVDYFIEDESIIKVADNTIIPLKMGKTELWAEYNVESVSDEMLVTVMPKVECDLCDNEEVIYVGDSTNICVGNFDGKISEFEILASDDIVEINGDKIKFVKAGKVDIVLIYKKDTDLMGCLSFEVKNTKPIIEADSLEIEVDDYVEFKMANYKSCNLFNFYVSDESILEIDDEYYGLALKPGKVIVTAKLKEDETVFSTIEITVKSVEIKSRISNPRILVGDEFTIDLYNYASEDVFDFEFSDNGIIEKVKEKTYRALKEGTTTLTVSLKDDKDTKTVINLVVYPINPIVQISSSVVEVGQNVKVSILNYLDIKDFDLEFSDYNLVEVNNDYFKALSYGNVILTVTKKSDKSIYTKLSIEIVPVQPDLYLSSDYIKVGGTSGLFIKNLELLDTNTLEKFDVEVVDKSVAKVENYILTGLKEGTTLVKVISKENSQIKGEVELKVTKTSSKKDINGETDEGVLLMNVVDSTDAKLLAGEFYQINIDEAVDRSNYRWISTDSTIATINDTGRIIAVSAGSVQIAAINKLNSEVKGSIVVTVYGIPNVDYAARLVKVATEELGYREGPNNDTKYGAWYNLNYEAWCAMFVSWCCNQAGISTDIVPKYCGCTAGMQWFMDRGLFQARESGYIPKAGDITFYRDRGLTSMTSTHTGIVYAATKTTVYTIEGNTSDMCAKRSYSLNSDYILGYGTPLYPEFDGEPATFTPGNPESGENLKTR